MPGIASYLRTQNISGLYHFTEVRNLKYIFDEGGLLSYQQLQQRHIPTRTGGDSVSLEIANRKNLTDYISLSFTPYTPMSSTRKLDHHLCFLVFRHEAADIPNVIFCNGNANANRTQRIPGMTGAQNINFSAILNGVAPSSGVWHDAARSEMLVPQRLSLEYLDRIVFVNGTSMQQGIELNSTGENYAFVVEKEMFYTDPTVDREIAFNTIDYAEFENCDFNGSSYVADRSKVSEITLRIRLLLFRKMRLRVTTQGKEFSDEWQGTYMGTMEIARVYPIRELVNDEYLFNIWLDGSFWRRKVVMVN